MLKLSFKKLVLFTSNITALGIEHYTYSVIRVKHSQSTKIAMWPVPTNATAVRSFLESIGITCQWIRNFAELSCPLSCLTGATVEWKWRKSKQLLFEFIRKVYSKTVEMFSIDFDLAVCMYSDASLYAAGLLITQWRRLRASIDGTVLASDNLVEHPV